MDIEWQILAKGRKIQARTTKNRVRENHLFYCILKDNKYPQFDIVVVLNHHRYQKFMVFRQVTNSMTKIEPKYQLQYWDTG